LLAAVLADRLAVAGSGLRARLGAAGSVPPGAGPGAGGVMFAVSYVGGDGAAGGFAFAAHGGDEAAMTVASRSAREWMAAVRSRRLVMAADAPLCWGGRRAASLMREAAAEGGPVHVLGHPVVGRESLDELRRLGVRSVADLDAVPDGGRVAFPAHGASLMARAGAEARGLRVVDATCPLVSAAARDAASYAGRGDLVVVIGHPGDAAVATLASSAGGLVAVVQVPEDASRLAWADGERVSFVIDPAMPASDSLPVLAALRARFPRIRGHHLDVMCEHGTDRAQAIASIAADSEVLIIIAGGGADAEDAGIEAVVRAAGRAGARPQVVRRLADISPGLLAGATSVGLAATLGAPRGLAGEVAGALSGLGPVTVLSRSVRTRREAPVDEDRDQAAAGDLAQVSSGLPRQVSGALQQRPRGGVPGMRAHAAAQRPKGGGDPRGLQVRVVVKEAMPGRDGLVDVPGVQLKFAEGGQGDRAAAALGPRPLRDGGS